MLINSKNIIKASSITLILKVNKESCLLLHQQFLQLFFIVMQEIRFLDLDKIKYCIKY
jgi:hypothetical protein